MFSASYIFHLFFFFQKTYVRNNLPFFKNLYGGRPYFCPVLVCVGWYLREALDRDVRQILRQRAFSAEFISFLTQTPDSAPTKGERRTVPGERERENVEEKSFQWEHYEAEGFPWRLHPFRSPTPLRSRRVSSRSYPCSWILFIISTDYCYLPFQLGSMRVQSTLNSRWM